MQQHLQSTLNTFFRASIAITVVVLVIALITVGRSATSDESIESSIGFINVKPVKYMLGDSYVITGGWSPVTAFKYDVWKRVILAKEFVVSPEKASKSKLLYLYDIQSMSPGTSRNLIEDIASGKAGNAVFLMGKKVGDELPETFYGTAFNISFVPTKKPPKSLTVEEYKKAFAHLKVAGFKSIDNAAPKSWKGIGKGVQLFVATDDPIHGVKSRAKVLTYDTLGPYFNAPYAHGLTGYPVPQP